VLRQKNISLYYFLLGTSAIRHLAVEGGFEMSPWIFFLYAAKDSI
jgi:hypothetical protein